MAKKIRPVSEEAPVIDNQSSANCLKEETSVEPKAPVFSPVESKLFGISNEQRAKLEAYDLLEAANRRLVQENIELQARIAEYLTELLTLREQHREVKPNREVEQLKSDVKALQESADSYLMKISDLTFENAKLKAQATNFTLEKDVQPHEPPVAKANFHKTRLEQPMCSPFSLNGYSSWN